jgi:hypothetical protein
VCRIEELPTQSESRSRRCGSRRAVGGQCAHERLLAEGLVSRGCVGRRMRSRPARRRPVVDVRHHKPVAAAAVIGFTRTRSSGRVRSGDCSRGGALVRRRRSARSRRRRCARPGRPAAGDCIRGGAIVQRSEPSRRRICARRTKIDLRGSGGSNVSCRPFDGLGNLISLTHQAGRPARRPLQSGWIEVGLRSARASCGLGGSRFLSGCR